MDWYYILLLVILGVLLAVLITSYICFRMTCYVKKPKEIKEINLPKDNFYEPYTDEIIDAMYEAVKMPHQKITICSHDGLKLHGRFYELKKDAPIEILFHGYKGNAIRDLGIGIKRCHLAGHSVLLVDQRSAGFSEGKCLSFGINERKDCLAWINYVIENINPNATIILSGVSMGAATVLLASGMSLPSNVIGVLADCGYDSAENIIKKCIKEMKLSPTFFYPFVRLGNLIFGHFDLNADSPIKAMKRTKLPIIFFHGSSDDFVPCSMSEKMFEACVSDKKRLVLIKNATHGLAYLYDKELYLQEVIDFFN